MKAYLKEGDAGSPKLKATRYKGCHGLMKGISAFDKLSTKNGNRARKKGARQEAKRHIRKLCT
jgi:hypothetical protein